MTDGSHGQDGEKTFFRVGRRASSAEPRPASPRAAATATVIGEAVARLLSRDTHPVKARRRSTPAREATPVAPHSATPTPAPTPEEPAPSGSADDATDSYRSAQDLTSPDDDGQSDVVA